MARAARKGTGRKEGPPRKNFENNLNGGRGGGRRRGDEQLYCRIVRPTARDSCALPAWPAHRRQSQRRQAWPLLGRGRGAFKIAAPDRVQNPDMRGHGERHPGSGDHPNRHFAALKTLRPRTNNGWRRCGCRGPAVSRERLYSCSTRRCAMGRRRRKWTSRWRTSARSRWRWMRSGSTGIEGGWPGANPTDTTFFSERSAAERREIHGLLG